MEKYPCTCLPSRKCCACHSKSCACRGTLVIPREIPEKTHAIDAQHGVQRKHFCCKFLRFSLDGANIASFPFKMTLGRRKWPESHFVSGRVAHCVARLLHANLHWIVWKVARIFHRNLENDKAASCPHTCSPNPVAAFALQALCNRFGPVEAPASLTALADIKAAVQELLPLANWQRCTNKDFRVKVEQQLQLAAATLDPPAQEVQAMAQEELQSQKKPARHSALTSVIWVWKMWLSPRGHIWSFFHIPQRRWARMAPPRNFTTAQVGACFLSALAATERSCRAIGFPAPVGLFGLKLSPNVKVWWLFGRVAPSILWFISDPSNLDGNDHHLVTSGVEHSRVVTKWVDSGW